MSKFFVCSCFYVKNYFIPKLNVHVTFQGKDAFRKDYGQFINDQMMQNHLSDKEVEEILDQLEIEYQRRCTLGKKTIERREIIKQNYTPLYRHVYTLKDSIFTPAFLDIAAYCKSPSATLDGLLPKLERQKAERVFSFPVFTKEFCRDLLSEVLHFEKSDLPKGRPNTMNKYGILLDEMGFDEGLLIPLRDDYLNPISRILYPECVGTGLDSHKAFVLSYSDRHDKDLDYHYDNAEVTLNVSLADEDDFDDGSLYFGDMRTVPNELTRYSGYSHELAKGLIHRGQHKHGAMPISSGERHNLIIWMRSSSVRNQLCPMCDEAPTLIETEGRGDGFSETTVDVCSLG